MPANVYPTVFGVALSGVKIKLADVNAESLNIDIENVKILFKRCESNFSSPFVWQPS